MPTSVVAEAINYTASTEFYNGIYVNLVSALIEVAVLTVTIPFVLSLVSRLRMRKIRALVDFYYLQILHKYIDLFMHMLAIKDPMTLLLQEMSKNSGFKICNNCMYGLLENNIFLVKKMASEEGLLDKELSCKIGRDYQYYEGKFSQIVSDIDTLIQIVPWDRAVQFDLLQLRIVGYVFRDMSIEMQEYYSGTKENTKIEEMYGKNNEESKEKLRSTMIELLLDVVKYIENDFAKHKKLIDSRLKNQYYLGIFMFCWKRRDVPLRSALDRLKFWK